MKAFFAIALGAAFGLTLFLNGYAAEPTVTVVLKAQNNSGEDGIATLTQHGSTVTVAVSVEDETTTPQPAHIHTGTCAKLGGVSYPLVNVVSGKSTTTLKGVTLASLQTGSFVINVHKSAADLGTYVSCGEIPKM